ncbi:MAG: hypothetical protein AAGC60_05400 [Acidobacteriota bacterium]
MTLLPGSFKPEPTSFPGPYQHSSRLPFGEWNMLANGRVYRLTISGLHGHRVDASMSSGTIQDAEWNDSASASTLATLSFTRVVANVGLKQIFSAYLLHFDPSDPFWRLVGTYGDINVGDQAGWYATLPR